MPVSQHPDPPDGAPPLGSWARLYALVAAVAVVVIALLWWFSVTWNVPLGGR